MDANENIDFKRSNLVSEIRQKGLRGEEISFKEKQALFSPSYAEEILQAPRDNVSKKENLIKNDNHSNRVGLHRKNKKDAKKVELSAGSIGSNVVISFEQEELVRIHYAVLIVRWSCVATLETAAREGLRKDGLMYIHLNNLQMFNNTLETSKIFPEEEQFMEKFNDIFLTKFIPLIHDQFNISRNVKKPAGDPYSSEETNQVNRGVFESFHNLSTEDENSVVSPLIELNLPRDIVTCFRLLVISERLKARLRHPAFRKILDLIGIDYNSKRSGSCSELIAQSNSFRLLRDYVLTIKIIPGPDSLQAYLITEAIKFLISAIPESLASIEDLIYLSTSYSKPTVAVQLFQQSTSYFLTNKSKFSDFHKSRYDEQKKEAEKFLFHLKSKLQDNLSKRLLDAQDKGLFDEFQNHLNSYKLTVHNKIQHLLGNAERRLVFATLNHGFVVEKFGTGLVCVWCENGIFKWMRLDKLRKQKDGFWIPYTEIIPNKSIFSALERKSPSRKSFDIRSPDQFTAQNTTLQSLNFIPGRRTRFGVAMSDLVSYIHKPVCGTISRDDIIGIEKNISDPFEASFRVKYYSALSGKRSPKDLIFRTKNKASCEVYIDIFNKWFLKLINFDDHVEDVRTNPGSMSENHSPNIVHTHNEYAGQKYKEMEPNKIHGTDDNIPNRPTVNPPKKSSRNLKKRSSSAFAQLSKLAFTSRSRSVSPLQSHIPSPHITVDQKVQEKQSRML